MDGDHWGAHTFHVSHLQIAISDQFLSQMVWIGMLMCTVSFRLINYMIFHFHSIPIHSPIWRGCVIYGELQSKCLSYNVMVIRNKLHDRWVIEMCVIPYQQQHQRQDEYITATMVIVTKCYQMTSPCKLVVINYIIFLELILYLIFNRDNSVTMK